MHPPTTPSSAPGDPASWDELVARARALLVEVAGGGATVTYADLLARLGAALPPTGERSLPALLRRVSTEEDRAGRGMLTAVVVRAGGLPGGGFFRLAEELGRDVSDRRRCWEEELDRVRATHAGAPG